MKKIKALLFIFIFCLMSSFILVKLTNADTLFNDITNAEKGGLDQIGYSYGQVGNPAPQNGIQDIAANIISWLLTFLGIIMVGLLIYGGYEWMTAGGNDDKVKEAQRTITNAIIGLAIILSAYAISYFVIQELINATGAR